MQMVEFPTSCNFPFRISTSYHTNRYLYMTADNLDNCSYIRRKHKAYERIVWGHTHYVAHYNKMSISIRVCVIFTRALRWGLSTCRCRWGERVYSLVCRSNEGLDYHRVNGKSYTRSRIMRFQAPLGWFFDFFFQRPRSIRHSFCVVSHGCWW